MNLAATNGFLTNVWWSNFESYNPNGDYSNCNYNWKLGYNILGGGAGCSPVYFGPGDYLFGPVYTNDSIFVSGDGSADRLAVVRKPGAVADGPLGRAYRRPQLPVRGRQQRHVRGPAATSPRPAPPPPVTSTSTPTSSNTTGPLPVSTYGHAVEPPPQSNAQLGTIASENGCLYSGPTQITLTHGRGPARAR